MADAHGSGPCVRKDVGVQLPPCPRAIEASGRVRSRLRADLVGQMREIPTGDNHPGTPPQIGIDRIGPVTHLAKHRLPRSPRRHCFRSDSTPSCSSTANSSQYCLNEQIRSPRNSATVTPLIVIRRPVGSMNTPPARANLPEWVRRTVHSAHAWSPPTSSGATSSSMSEKGGVAAFELGGRGGRKGGRPCRHIIGVRPPRSQRYHLRCSPKAREPAWPLERRSRSCGLLSD
jgi:hypothetical protein